MSALNSIKNPPPAVASPSPRKGSPRKTDVFIFPWQSLSWPALLGEANALLNRLRADLQMREGLIRYLAPCVVNTAFGADADFGAPQRLCFLWRQASEIVRWENFTDFGSEVLEACQ